MTYMVEFNGHELNIDPADFTGLELSLVKQRSGLTFRSIAQGLQELDGDAIRVLFWVAERRHDPDVKFSDYEGPSLRFFMKHVDGLGEALDDLGKGASSETSPEMNGSPSSSSETDAPELSSML